MRNVSLPPVLAAALLVALGYGFAHLGVAWRAAVRRADLVAGWESARYAPCSACGAQCGPGVSSGPSWNLCPPCAVAARDERVPDGGILRWARQRLAEADPFQREALLYKLETEGEKPEKNAVIVID